MTDSLSETVGVFSDRFLPVRLPYVLTVSDQTRVIEKLCRGLRCHVEPGVFAFLAQVQVVSNLEADPSITFLDKMRLYDGEAVYCPRTGAQYLLADVRAQAGAKEGTAGLSSRECMYIVHQCAQDSLKAAGSIRNFLQLARQFTGPNCTAGSELTYALVTKLHSMNDGPEDEHARRARSEILYLLGQKASGDDLARMIATLTPQEEPNRVNACVSLRSVRARLLERLKPRHRAFLTNELKPVYRLDLRRSVIRTIEPKFDALCEDTYRFYVEAIQRVFERPDQPLLMRAKEIEQLVGLKNPDHARSFRSAVIYRMCQPPSNDPRDRIVPVLARAIERLVIGEKSNALGFTAESGSGGPNTIKTITDGLIKQAGHCPICAYGAIDQILNDRDFLVD